MKYSETEFGSVHTETEREARITARIIRHSTVVPDPRAELAFYLAQGFAAGGVVEGRYIANKACELAEAMFAACDARGWLMPLPDYGSLIERPAQD
jgi:hypothetical protein